VSLVMVSNKSSCLGRIMEYTTFLLTDDQFHLANRAKVTLSFNQQHNVFIPLDSLLFGSSEKLKPSWYWQL